MFRGEFGTAGVQRPQPPPSVFFPFKSNSASLGDSNLTERTHSGLEVVFLIRMKYHCAPCDWFSAVGSNVIVGLSESHVRSANHVLRPAPQIDVTDFQSTSIRFFFPQGTPALRPTGDRLITVDWLTICGRPRLDHEARPLPTNFLHANLVGWPRNRCRQELGIVL